MQSHLARMAPWFSVSGILVFALGVAAGELSFSQVAFAAQTKAPSSQGAPASRATARTPPVRTDETSVQALTDLKDSLKALNAAVQEQGRRLEELIERQEQQEKHLTQLVSDIAMLTSRQEQQTDALAAVRTDAEEVLSRAYRERTVALAVAGVFTLVTLGAFLFFVYPGRPLPPVSPVKTAAGDAPPVVTPTKCTDQRASLNIQTAACSLSSPKGEDVILRAKGAHFSAIVIADGASTLRRSGSEHSGGGGQAAELAAKTAVTYLTRKLLPAMGIGQMLTLLEDCFRDVRTALEEYNAPAQTPGATTLLIGMLCQAGDGRWYWLSGHVGNGVLALLHTKERLSSWPIHTPLLTRHTNGVTTITLPGDKEQGFFPSVGVRLHRMGDLLVIGSDGLDHLDTLTKQRDRLTFLNYLWKIVQDERSSLERALKALETDRQDEQWQKALVLDDTTIGMLWA
jgi:hypothetical protein